MKALPHFMRILSGKIGRDCKKTIIVHLEALAWFTRTLECLKRCLVQKRSVVDLLAEVTLVLRGHFVLDYQTKLSWMLDRTV